MRGRLYIDGKDIYTNYGMYVESGGWNELIAMPPLKAVTYNDWHEEDGIEPDLSHPVLNSRDISVRFALNTIYSRYFALIGVLSDGAYHTFDCPYIGRAFRLRLLGIGSLSVQGDLGKVTMKFADDFPLDGYSYQAPESTIAQDGSFTLDGVPMSDYGLRILKGSLSEITRTPDIKVNMLRNITTQTGAVYDPETVTYKSKDVKLSCLMVADTLRGLWRNYDALLYNLTQPEERKLGVNSLEKEFHCFYKSCNVEEFYPDHKIWLRFTLTLTFTNDLRIVDDGDVLASESDIIIFTEEGTYAIDLQADIYDPVTLRLVDADTLRLSTNRKFLFNN